MSKFWFGILGAVVIAAFFGYLIWQGQAPGVKLAENIVKEAAAEEAALSAVAGFSGGGVARRGYDGKEFALTVSADLNDPSADKFYEVWLVRSHPFDFFSAGELIKSGGKYKLGYTAEQDYSDYSRVIITLETKQFGLDGVPEEHVLEGEF